MDFMKPIFTEDWIYFWAGNFHSLFLKTNTDAELPPCPMKWAAVSGIFHVPCHVSYRSKVYDICRMVLPGRDCYSAACIQGARRFRA